MTVQITLGGQPVQDAIAERQNLALLGYPAPPNFDRANSILNPLGESPGRGWFLMLRQDLADLDLNGLQTLVMQDDIGNSASVRNLVIAREPACITPSGSTSDGMACFLVEVADARYRCHNPYFSIPLDAQYNVRAPGYGGLYYAASINGSNPWGWSAMVGDIWGKMSTQLGAFPGLPSSPDGQPERYRYLGVSAWRALCQVLDKLGMAVAWDAAAATYRIVSRGVADASSTSAINAAAGRLIFDRQFQAVVRGRVPAGVRVHFHRVQEHYGSEPATPQDSSQFITSNVYTVDVSGGALAAGAEPSTFHPLWDDLPALYDPSGNLLNSAALATRAQTRATAYYASIQGNGGNRSQQVYAGLVKARPGGTISGVAWRQDMSSLGDPGREGGGLVTEVVRVPVSRLRVSDAGQFEEEFADSSALHPPDLRVKEPVYPDLCQLVRLITGTPDDGGFYDALLQIWNADLQAWQDHESIWVIDANG